LVDASAVSRVLGVDQHAIDALVTITNDGTPAAPYHSAMGANAIDHTCTDGAIILRDALTT
jgi:hypothetical protein